MNKLNAKNILILSFLLMAIAVMLGAFGAHGLKKILEPKFLLTFETGVRYHMIHSLALALAGILSLFKVNSQKASLLFIIGIFLFSFNCYLYAMTQIKFFAMIIPLGGLSFILGWFIMAYSTFKDLK